jgi:hypothetical protein
VNPSSIPLDLGRGRDGSATMAGYRVHGVALIVRADDPEILARVHDTYGWFADDRLAPTPTQGDASPGRGRPVEVAYRSRAGGGATIVDAAGRAVDVAAADQPLVALFDAIVSGLIGGLAASGILAIHAGAVTIDGRAVVIAGRSGRGKTTLVLELLRRGAAFVSDELALIGTDDRTVLAYPRGVHLRRSALGLFPELGDLAALPSHALGGGSEWSVGPAALERAFGASVTAQARLGAVILLDGDPAPETEPELAWVPGAMAAMELLRGTPAAAWDFDGVLARLPRVIADVPCARLRSARLGPTADAIVAWATASFADDR